MTDVQQPPAETPSDAYGQPISADRQAKLQQMLDAWDGPNADHGDRKGPFDGVRLTGAEVFWLAKASGRDRYDGRCPTFTWKAPTSAEPTWSEPTSAEPTWKAPIST